MNLEKFECKRLGNEYKSLLEQICYFLDYKSYISKVNIDKIRDLALKLETGECEIIQFKRTLCKFDVEHKIKEEVEKKGKQKDKEIKRLNNIINKLEKWLEQEYAIVKANSIQEPNNPEWYIKWNERKNTLDKLQELKGGINNG